MIPKTRGVIQLIDGNSIGYANHMSTKLTNGSMPTQAIYGTIRTLRSLKTDSPKAKQIVLWDGRAQWRRDIYPDYKANRRSSGDQVKIYEEYKAQSKDMQAMITHIGVDQVICPKAEADDLAAAYCHVFRDFTINLITADKDWLQLVKPNVSWFDPVHDKFCSTSDFEVMTGFKTPDLFVQAKALTGDASDNIKGVGGIGEVNAAKLLKAYGSADTFLKMYDQGKIAADSLPKAWHNFAKDAEKRQAFIRNRKLMTLCVPVPGIKDSIITKGKFSRDDFKSMCENLAFLSILQQLDNWLTPFNPAV
jgi:5'-3' exonuclease